MEIKQNLTTVNFNSANKTNKYIVVHYTGNSTDTAWANTNYFKSVNRNASAHYFVDDNNIYQCVKDKDIAWHCGGGRQGSGGGTFLNICTNNNSIGIEMCCTNYGVSTATENRTVELVKYLMNKYNIPVSNVIRHYDVTGKNCPAPMVNNQARWNNFKAKLNGNSTPVTPSNNTGYTGDITYQVYDNVKRQWLPEVINDRDYAGNINNAIGGVRAKCKNGTITIQSHIKGGSWLSSINSNTYAINSSNGNSYSGIFGKPIDGIKIWSSQGYVDYRVHLKNGGWLDWVNSKNASGTGGNSYAGIYGREIDAIQMK